MADDLIAMFASITTSDHDALVAQFSKVLQIEPNVAQFFLESSSWNVETAINTFLASVGTRANLLNVQTQPKAVLTCQPEFVSGQRLAPNARRSIMVHLKNSGKCPWPSDTRLVFVEGTQLTTVKAIRVPTLDPGQEQFFNVEIVTPHRPGDYAASYRLSYGGGYISEAMWALVTVDPALAAVAAAAPTFSAAAAAAAPTVSMGAAAGAADFSMDMAPSPTGAIAAPPTAAAAVAPAGPSLFAPSSFAAPAPTGAAAGSQQPAAPPTFTFTGFRTTAPTPAAAPTSLAGMFGGTAFGGPPAQQGGGGGAADDTMMDL